MRSFTRRTAIMSVGAGGFFAVLFGRLYELQVLYADRYRMQADENRIKVRLLAPLRGRIVDRFGEELAGNRQNLRVVLVPEDTDGRAVAEILEQLGRVIDLPDGRRKRILQQVRRNAGFVPVSVADNLTWREFAQINLLSPDLPGVLPEVGDTRYYPYADYLGHVVGYVGSVTDRDLRVARTSGEDPLLRLPGFRVGKDGVERKLDRKLRGKGGNKRVEINARGREIRVLKQEEGTPGAESVLTLDMDIQRAAVESLQGESGAAVVMDIHSGEVLALASVPSFDPNAFSRGLSQTEWDKLLKNPLKPLINKAIQGQYPPGSTVKPIVAMAALEYGVMSPDETIHCSGKVTLGDRQFHCWKHEGHGPMNMHSGIQHSCDIYFYEAARRLGVDRLAQVFKNYGLGETTGFELPNEKDGLVPTKGWKLAVTGQPWVQGETYNVGIGQGYMLTTPLQLAVMTARIANGGRSVEPRIVRAVGEDLLVTPSFPRMPISSGNLAVVKAAMDAVTNDVRGTAFSSRLDGDGMSMAGKTGTVQVRRISKKEREQGVRKNEELPWRLRDHAMFVGYGPVDDPRYAVSVVVEHGGSGSKAAAPRARDIMRAVLMRDPAARPAVGPSMRIGEQEDGEVTAPSGNGRS